MDSLDTPLHNPEYAEISVNVVPESGTEGNIDKGFEKFFLKIIFQTCL